MNAKNKWNRITRSLFTISLIITVLALQGCGGSSSETTPVTNANPTGYYDATGTAGVKQTNDTTDLVISDLQGMVNGDRFIMMSTAAGLHYDGTITTISGNSFNANVIIYKDGQNPFSATIAGTITEGSQITGSLTGTGAGNGTFTLVYGQFNDVVSSLSSVQTGIGEWRTSIGGASDETLFYVNSSVISDSGASADGFFQGCKFSGTITPITNTSLYEVNFTFSACSPNTAANVNYVGLAANVDNNNDQLLLAATDANNLFSVNGLFL